jgi:hypothetical protein
MDLTDLPLSQLRGVSLASWFRFQRAIEKTPTALVVISPESMVKSAAALVLHLEMKHAEWTTLLAGRNVNVEIVRSRRSLIRQYRGNVGWRIADGGCGISSTSTIHYPPSAILHCP